MRYGNHSRFRTLISSPVGIVILILIFGLLARATWNIHRKAAESAGKLAEADANLARLEAHQADLGKQVEYLSSDAGIEAELRTKYHAVRDGESVAVIIDNSQTAAAVTATTTPVHWWQKVLQAVGL